MTEQDNKRNVKNIMELYMNFEHSREEEKGSKDIDEVMKENQELRGQLDLLIRRLETMQKLLAVQVRPAQWGASFWNHVPQVYLLLDEAFDR